MMRKCPNCNQEIIGRIDKKFCSPYCKSNFNYEKNKEKEDSLFKKIDKQLKLNRRILKDYNRAGKATVRKQILLSEGFHPKFFTHYWKNNKGQVYLFVFEFGFLELKENDQAKYVLIQWQSYMK